MADLVTRISDVITAIGTSIKGKQDKLVSATNIKSINGASLLGSGDLSVGATRVVKNQQESTVTATTMTNIDSLSNNILAADSIYQIDCFVIFSSTSISVGAGIGYSLSASPLFGALEVVVPISASQVASALRITFPNGSKDASFPLSGSVISPSVSVINTQHTARISGVIRTNNPITLNIQARSENSGAVVTIEYGSTLILTKIG